MNGPLGPSNPRVQRLRRLLGRRSSRRDEGVFVVEGIGLLREAVRGGWSVESVYLGPDAPADAASIAPDAELHHVAAGVIERIATTSTPQPVLAVVSDRAVGLADVHIGGGFVVVGDRLADPGNVGTIVRSAEAAGASAVVLTSGSADARSPKVLRSSAGAVFHIPVIEDLAPSSLAVLGVPLVATSSHHGVPLEAADLTGPLALVVGNEAHGVDPSLDVASWVTIPHAGRSESLNVAMAATVLCFEIARQRRARR